MEFDRSGREHFDTLIARLLDEARVADGGDDPFTLEWPAGASVFDEVMAQARADISAYRRSVAEFNALIAPGAAALGAVREFSGVCGARALEARRAAIAAEGERVRAEYGPALLRCFPHPS